MKAIAKKNIIRSFIIALCLIFTVIIGYLAYVLLSYYRVEDHLTLNVDNGTTDTLPVRKELSAVTYNIGFGAYSDDYSFFMDGGKYSRAYSKKAVIDNTTGAVEAVKEQNADILLFQEVDVRGTRSYNVDQTKLIKESFSAFDSVFGQNYDSAYLFYPFSEPIGANKSGLLTLSKYDIASSERRSLPVEDSLYKFLDLDRAYTVSVIPTENGKNLVLYNVHLSAYTSDGTIADEQLKMLSADMKAQYDKGNYVLAGGDFNKDLLGDSSKYFKRSTLSANWAKPFDISALPKEIRCYSGMNLPTCRNADAPFKNDGTDFVLSVDGFLVSNNIDVTSSYTLPLEFKYSDHNPVKLSFILK